MSTRLQVRSIDAAKRTWGDKDAWKSTLKALAEKDEDQEKALKKAVTVAKINAARAAGPSGRTAWPSRAQEV